jgi:hypothetical protein
MSDPTAGPGTVDFERDGVTKTIVFSGEVRIDGLLDDGWTVQE